MIWRCLIAALALALPTAAKADYWTPAVDVTCDRRSNVAVIRFGGGWTDGKITFRKLPRRLDRGLSMAKPSKRAECVLPNGWRLRIRDGQKQAFVYGMGGADPPAFFSLWINRRRIVSAMQWKPGYGEEAPLITALIVRPDRLTWCRAPDDESNPRRQTCTSETFKLGRYRADRVEFPPNGRKWKVGTLFATRIAASEGFCRRYVARMRARMLDGVAFDFALFGHSEAPFAWDLPIKALPATDISQADIEIAPGVRRRLLIKHGTNHFFDGDVVFILPPGTDPRPLLSRMEFSDGDPNAFPLEPVAGWTRLIGGSRDIYPQVSPRYVHFIPERIDRHLYFLASPASVETRPTALLVGVKSEGGAQVMCRIQRVEPHF